MAYPIESDYNAAFQNLNLTLLDTGLKNGTVLTEINGLPKQLGGSNASVFQVVQSKEKWAIRCFLKEISDRSKRYGLISKYINKSKHKFFVPFAFMDQGIRVNGIIYPAVKMKWIDGITIERYVDYYRSNKAELDRFLKQWVDLIATLKKDSVAHGDLQHGNIMYSNNGQIYLIDYDEMFVPGLESFKSNVIGHPNFQHSMRDANYFNESLDDFSAWVIFCSVKALCNDHRLWDDLKGGDDCLLFRQSDYLNFRSSEAFLSLAKSKSDENKKIADLMCQITEAKIDKVLSFSTKSFTEFGKPKPKPKQRRKQHKLVFNDDWIKDHLIPSDTKSRKQSPVEAPEKGDSQKVAADESWIFDHIDAKSFRTSESPASDDSSQPKKQELEIPENPVPGNWMDDYVKKKVAALDCSDATKPLFSISPFSLLSLTLYGYVNDFSRDSLLISCGYFSIAIPYVLVNYSAISDMLALKRNSLADNRSEIGVIKNKLAAYMETMETCKIRIQYGIADCDIKTISINSKIGNQMVLVNRACILKREFDALTQELLVLEKELTVIEADLLNKRAFVDRKTLRYRSKLKKEKESKHINFILSCWTVQDNIIQDLDEKEKMSLVRSGITSAIDVSKPNLDEVVNLSESTRNTLLKWKMQITKKAKLSIPKKIGLEIDTATEKFAKGLKQECLHSLEQRLEEIQNILKPAKSIRYSEVQALLSNIHEADLNKHKMAVLRLNSEVVEVDAKKAALQALLHDCDTALEKCRCDVAFVDNELTDSKSHAQDLFPDAGKFYSKYSGLSFSFLPSSFSDKVFVTLVVAYCVVYYASIL